MRAAISRLTGAGMLIAALSGCAGFWDEVSSRDFSMRNTISPPEPMTVLRTSTDGDARAKAMRRLKEPAKNGNTAEQDEAVKLLSEAALGDPSPVCRMAAINTLGRFQDPRAVPALVNAYESADRLTPDVSYMVRCQALNALGETKNPTAADYLVKVAREPVKSDMTTVERSQMRDVRLAAVRSLRNFPGTATASEAAAQLAQSEKDVAVRDRARETYAVLTGQSPSALPPSAPVPDTSVQSVKHEQPAH